MPQLPGEDSEEEWVAAIRDNKALEEVSEGCCGRP